jgi:hypothetical protein
VNFIAAHPLIGLVMRLVDQFQSTTLIITIHWDVASVRAINPRSIIMLPAAR